MQVVEVHPAHQFVGAIAQNHLRPLADIGVEALSVHFPNVGGALLGKLGKAFFAFPHLSRQLLSHPPRIGARVEQGEHQPKQEQTDDRPAK